MTLKWLHVCALAVLFLPAIGWGQLLDASNELASLPDAPAPQPFAQQPSSATGALPRLVATFRKSKGSLPPCPVPLPSSVALPMLSTTPGLPLGDTPTNIPLLMEVRPSSNSFSSSSGAASPPLANAVFPVVPCGTRNPFQRFLSTSAPDPLTVKEKLILSGKDVIDPFNLITVGGLSSLYVMQNAHSDYGPGMFGFGKNAGVSLTQDMTGEFIGTFLLPALMHQDPRYHRMPNARLSTRIGHVIVQTLVTQGDNGRPRFNYGNFPGFLIEDEISNLYVPMRHTNIQSTTARVVIGLATVPIGNAITEFLPDIARHINFNVVFLQRIINQVSGRDGVMSNQ